jgi:hypothetical protein
VRKIILGILIAVLLISVAGSAMASSAKWVVMLRAGSLSGGSMSGFASISLGGNATPATAISNIWADTKANIATYQGTSFYSTETQDTDIAAPYTYNFVVSMGANFNKEADNVTYKPVWVSAWNPESAGFPVVSGYQLPSDYVMTVKRNGQTLATWTHDNLYGVTGDTPAPGGVPGSTAPGRVGFWYNASVSTGYATSNDVFTITVGPASIPNTPEPGSLLALGSGLVGLAGFAIRRRRA